MEITACHGALLEFMYMAVLIHTHHMKMYTERVVDDSICAVISYSITIVYSFVPRLKGCCFCSYNIKRTFDDTGRSSATSEIIDSRSFSFYFQECNVKEHKKEYFVKVFRFTNIILCSTCVNIIIIVIWLLGMSHRQHKYIYFLLILEATVIIVCLINDIAIHIKIPYSLIFRLQRSISSLLFFFSISKSGTKLLIPFETSF